MSRTADYLFLAIVGKTTGWVAVGKALFRFNRRRSHSRGMVFYRLLELAVAHAPVRYEGLQLVRQKDNR